MNEVILICRTYPIERPPEVGAVEVLRDVPAVLRDFRHEVVTLRLALDFLALRLFQAFEKLACAYYRADEQLANLEVRSDVFIGPRKMRQQAAFERRKKRGRVAAMPLSCLKKSFVLTISLI